MNLNVNHINNFLKKEDIIFFDSIHKRPLNIEIKKIELPSVNFELPPLSEWDSNKDVKIYNDSELKALPLQKKELMNVDGELKKLLKELISEIEKDLKLIGNNNNNFIDDIKSRLAFLEGDLKDSGFIFQQLYFASNKISSKKNINRYLNYSTPDRAILGYLEELLRFKFSARLSFKEEAEIESCIDAVKNSLKIALMNSVCIYNKNKKTKFSQKNTIKLYLESRLNNLEILDSFSIPCGYFKGSPYSFLHKGTGHAIMCDIKRINNNFYEITVINTGEGKDKEKNVYLVNKEELIQTNFFDKLSFCLEIPRSSKKSGIDHFYDCFESFTSIKNIEFADQLVDSCTQFSFKAYINYLLKDNSSLWNKFDAHFYQSVSQKCENFLVSVKNEKLNKTYVYRHPLIKPSNILQFIFVWLLCLLMCRLIVYKNKQYGFKISKRDYTTLFLESKANF